MTEKDPFISIVSPVYGCKGCLEALVDAVRAAFQDQGLSWELILVDDRSPDEPWEVITELAAQDRRVTGVRLTRNHGQHLAIWAGLKAARGDWVAVIDCDLQDDPAIIPTLYETARNQDVNAVVVERGDWSDSIFRRLASNLFYRLVGLLAGVELKNIGNFGIYSRRMVDTLLLFQEQEVFLPMMVSLTGLSASQFTLDRSERLKGHSSYSVSRLINLAISIVVRFSDKPLRLSVVAGMVISGLSAVISFLLLAAWAGGFFTVPGWTSIILSVWFLSGLIMAVLGVHGFYLGRVFAEVQGRPRILIETTTATE